MLKTITINLITAVSGLTLPLMVFAQNDSATGTPGYIYLSQVPYTGFGDFAKFMGFIIMVALWSVLVVLLVKNSRIKSLFKRMFRDVNEDAELAPTSDAGYVFDLNDSQILNMNMNPVHNSLTDIFVAKENGLNGNGSVGIEELNLPTNGDHSFENSEPAVMQNHQKNGDLTTDVNSFVNLVVRGDEAAVFEYIRKIKARGISISDFASNVILELDSAYRARIDGENNKRNIVLSQIVSHWSRSKIENVMVSLLSIVDKSYADQNLGMKVALMRIMRS